MFLHLFLDAAIMEIERNTMLQKFIFSVHGVLTRAEPKAGPYDPRCEFIRKRRISYQKFQCANCGDIFIQEDENYPRDHPEMSPTFQNQYFPKRSVFRLDESFNLSPHPLDPKQKFFRKLRNFLELNKILVFSKSC